MIRYKFRFGLWAVACASAFAPVLAFAQASPPAAAPVNLTPPQPGSTYVPIPAQVVAPESPSTPSGPIGGGNATESSAHPLTGDQEDTFDLGAAGKGESSVHGSEGGPIFSGRSATVAGVAPASHIVRRGDTLWSLCDLYFKNPYEWPRIWSYNGQIKNPNWIYPGDELRMRAPGDDAVARRPGPLGYDPNKMTLIDRRRQVPTDTVFLRDQGWISDESDEVWGEVTGSAQETMFLSDLNQIYVSIRKGHDVQIGQELTIFRTRSTAKAGAIVQILGTLRINQYNEQERVARAQVTETLDVIERGAQVGPLLRSFAIVRPTRSESDVQAHVLASLHPSEFFGQNQVVFIDKGEAAGLKPGNRLVFVRRGDAWRQTLVSADSSYRISADDERPMPPLEKTPGSRGDDAKYPEEALGELRVLVAKKDSSVCLVTQSRSEIELGDVVIARKGH